VPEQQPFEHEAAVHWQLPDTHTCPAEQAGPPPQEQLPPWHRSATVELHEVQALPPAPQFVVEGVSQVLPLQQPEVHVCEQPSHTLLTQLPVPHEPQALPPDPHAAFWLPGMHTLPWQHPPGQLAALQTHAPPTQARPAPQAAPVPHLHAPPEHESLVVELHTPQDPPPVPHVAVELALQTPPAQQPPAQDVASHTHCPPEHRCPLTQAGPLPHEQLPAVQPSATVELQDEHPLPPAPHEVTPAELHVVPLQQPDAHEVASQTHAPLTQCWPAAQGAPVPHAHEPPEQESARIGSQATQATPLLPQVAVEGELQVLPVQHPLVHWLEQSPQTPLVQSCPDPQAVQAAPPVPQAVGSGDVLQTLPLQHPPAQDVASQVHVPPTQCWPAAHGAPLPHAQLPAVHESDRTASQATQEEPVAPPVPHCPRDCVWHCPPTQQPPGHEVALQTQLPPEQSCPGAQADALPHLQAPPVHESDSCESQAMQDAPPVPQEPNPVAVVQVLPLQQPLAHDVGSQTHWPPRHRCPVEQAA
jgi:hypothetical protein